MHVPDTIERTLTLPHPPERIWRALTEPEEIAGWFGERAEVPELRPGGRMVIDFGEYGSADFVITGVEPPRRLVWAWRSFPGWEGVPVLDGPHTVITWTLEPAGDGTTLTMVESGFAALPEELAAAQHKDNTGGWDQGLEDLRAYLAA